ncbi:hypothetical protein Pcaca01_33860 [Pectobacterium carotovorum subsp. carotovorum]|nr:hypothetical protein Pcaca01_33860 [Pectobacterium carotovorum subsp. carotovorum]
MGTRADNARKSFESSLKRRYIPEFKGEVTSTISFIDFRNTMKTHGVDASLSQFNDFMKNHHSDWFKSKKLENTYYK